MSKVPNTSNGFCCIHFGDHVLKYSDSIARYRFGIRRDTQVLETVICVVSYHTVSGNSALTAQTRVDGDPMVALDTRGSSSKSNSAESILQIAASDTVHQSGDVFVVPEQNLVSVSPTETIRDDGDIYSILDLYADEHATQQGEEDSTVELRIWRQRTEKRTTGPHNGRRVTYEVS